MPIEGTNGADLIEIESQFANQPTLVEVDTFAGNDRIVFRWHAAGAGDGDERVQYDVDGGTWNDTLEFYVEEGEDSSFVLDARTGQLEEVSFTAIERVRLFGRAGNDILYGLDANDYLSGGGGSDQAYGGLGTDTYLVQNKNDLVIENAGGGHDFVRATISYRLPEHVEDLILLAGATNGIGNDSDNYLTGNDAANELFGGWGADRLDGGGGADILHGGPGGDIYYLDHAGDSVIESSSAAGGIDLVYSSVSHSLRAYVENLVLTGGGDVDGTGNLLVNRITGNSGDNRLDGRGGADRMAGAAGNDTYFVDDPGDQVLETLTGGRDQVFSPISYRLTAYVEKLTLTGSAAIDGIGNGDPNVLIGNSAANTLEGSAGRDTLRGGGGDDRLFGGPGNDRLRGEAGADGFYFNSPLHGQFNVDSIINYSVSEDTIYLDGHTFPGLDFGPLSPQAFRAGTTALDADDRILYHQATGRIFFDSDGAGGAAAILFATVNDGTALTYLDFNVYQVD